MKLKYEDVVTGGGTSRVVRGGNINKVAKNLDLDLN